jgi:thioredoxin-like negative regulator of GroEL
LRRVIDPSDGRALFLRMQALFAVGDYTTASELLQRWLDDADMELLAPQDLSLLFEHSVAYDDYLSALEDHVHDEPTDAGARFLLSFHYYHQGRSEAAVRHLIETLDLAPGHGGAAFLLPLVETRH